MDTDNRKRKRAPIDVFVSEKTGGKYFSPLLLNLNDDGAFIQYPANQERPFTHETILELLVPGVSEVIWVRCRHVREQPDGFFKARALQFVNISPLHRHYLRLYVQRTMGLS